jgi:hypothetical protein
MYDHTVGQGQKVSYWKANRGGQVWRALSFAFFLGRRTILTVLHRNLFGSSEARGDPSPSSSTPVGGPSSSQYHDTPFYGQFSLSPDSSGVYGDPGDRTLSDLLALTSPAKAEPSDSTAVTTTQGGTFTPGNLSASSTDSRLYISEVAGFLASDLISTWFSMVSVKLVFFECVFLLLDYDSSPRTPWQDHYLAPIMDWSRFMNAFQAAGRRPEQMSPMDEVNRRRS